MSYSATLGNRARCSTPRVKYSTSFAITDPNAYLSLRVPLLTSTLPMFDTELRHSIARSLKLRSSDFEAIFDISGYSSLSR